MLNGEDAFLQPSTGQVMGAASSMREKIEETVVGFGIGFLSAAHQIVAESLAHVFVKKSRQSFPSEESNKAYS